MSIHSSTLSTRPTLTPYAVQGSGPDGALVGAGLLSSLRSTAIRSLDNMLIHTMFIGADGIDAQWGLSCFSSDEADLNGTIATDEMIAPFHKLGIEVIRV